MMAYMKLFLPGHKVLCHVGWLIKTDRDWDIADYVQSNLA